jgi:raffinose/stachyose/melibiose transport system substrate-binding protein
MSHPGPSRPRHRRRPVALTLAAVGGILLTACSAPGSSSTSTSATATTSGAAASGAAAGVPGCGTGDVTLSAYFETGFPLPKALTDEFSRQHPNVKWTIREDQFAVITQNAPRVLADNPPDLMRLPQMSELAKDKLLKNLDPYATAFGWDRWPSSQLVQLRVDADGRRGTGPLYGMGLNFSLTGVFYNKDLAARIGMTQPPATLADLDAAMDKAKKAGILPIQQFNGGATGGLLFPLQQLMADYGPAGPINDWIFQKPGATIDTPANQQAAQHLEKWVQAGYFAKDVNAVDYPTMMSRFIGGQGLFMFDGDWESANLDKQLAGKVGFFLMPPLTAGGKQAAMSAPLTVGIADKAKHADCAASFLNWVATDQKARDIAVTIGGSHPLGPPDAHMPATRSGTVTAATLDAGAKVVQDDGAMDFIANATGAIYAKSWTPNVQKLAAGQQTPQGLLSAVQKDYLSQSGS